MVKKDYYNILGVEKKASKEEIKKAYKVLAKKHHPDLSKEEDSAEKFKEISAAYAVLSDDQKRAQYDQFGPEAFDQRFSREDIFRDFDFDIFRNAGFGGFDNIFDMFFGRGRKGERRGMDLHLDLKLTLKEAAFGVEKMVKVPRHETCKDCSGEGAEKGGLEECKACHGEGRVQSNKRTPFGVFSYVSQCGDCYGKGKKITKPCKECKGKGLLRKERDIHIKIPEGVDNGTQIRLPGEGEVSEDHIAGDLYVTTHVIPHEDFEREGSDILLDKQISIIQAIFGTKITVPTLQGDATIIIPAGTQSHTIFPLRGMGVPHLRTRGKGDQLVKVMVDVPKKLSKEQREVLEKYAKVSGEKLPKKGFFKKILE